MLTQQKFLHDLQWVIKSCPLTISSNELPNVTEEECVCWGKEVKPLLNSLNDHPEKFHAFLLTIPSKRLGDYFASLVEFWLLNRSDVLHLKSRIQIIDQQTIGEFDFIYWSLTQQSFIHLEVAVKFFLKYQDSNGLVQFLGPNPRDSWETKINHLINRQLKLSFHPAAKNWLIQEGINSLKKQCFLKGYLFYPWIEVDNSSLFPPFAHPHHLHGWWIYYQGKDWPLFLKNVLKESASHFVILNKLEWLAPFMEIYNPLKNMIAAKDLEAVLMEHFLQNNQNLLIAQLKKNEKGMWIEENRGFIVSSHWPYIHHQPKSN